MEKDKTGSRLNALDGLRGFAIILVFLNHINTTYIASLFPPYLFGWIFSNGVTGVTFLFILSGFLMSYLYPHPANPLQFLQKRYTRIFPLFLTMVAVMVAYRLAPNTPWSYFLGLIAVSALITHFLWVYVVKKLPKVFGTILFFSFICIQLAVGAAYSLWVMRQPPVVFSQLPFAMREGIIGLVNGTLTLPLGDYVPMLDGVYWTLVAEVLFYVIYPFLFAPLAGYISSQNKKVQVLFVLCLMPFFGGLSILAQRIAGLSLLQLELFYYFVTGVTLGTVFKNNPGIVQKFSSFFSGKLKLFPILLFFIAMASVHAIGMLVSNDIDPWVRLAYAIPLTLLVALLLDSKNILAKIGSTKVLIFIGTVSYSIYLSHAIIIHLFESLYIPTNLLTNIAYVGFAFLACVLVAYFLFHLLEKPYFKRGVETKQKKMYKTKNYNPKIIVGGVLVIYMFFIFAVYSSTLNFFSIPVQISAENIISPRVKSSEITLQNNQPLEFVVHANQDNFGVITMKAVRIHLGHSDEPQTLQFQIKEKGAKSIHSSANYSLDYFEKEHVFPFGFPQIAESKGTTYVVQLSIANSKSSETLLVHTDSMAAVYPVNKKELIKNPDQIVTFFRSKITHVLNSKEARIVFFPILLVLPFLFLNNRKNNHK